MVEEVTRIDPDFGTLVVECIKELEIKYSQYGNTWLEQDDLYYKERLLKEVQEYTESMTIASERRKLLNIVNIAAMAWQTAKTNRGCRKHKAPWEAIMKSEQQPVPTNCIICSKALVVRRGSVYLEGEKYD